MSLCFGNACAQVNNGWPAKTIPGLLRQEIVPRPADAETGGMEVGLHWARGFMDEVLSRFVMARGADAIPGPHV